MTYFKAYIRLSRRGGEKPQKFFILKLIEIRVPYVRNVEPLRTRSITMSLVSCLVG
jgi:hypothetical protein